MGTHPIFESDFDCLTDLCDMSKLRYATMTLISVFQEHCGSDQKLNKAELRELLEEEYGDKLKNTSDRNVSDEILNALDQDRDGHVDFLEFVTMVATLAYLCP